MIELTLVLVINRRKKNTSRTNSEHTDYQFPKKQKKKAALRSRRVTWDGLRSQKIINHLEMSCLGAVLNSTAISTTGRRR